MSEPVIPMTDARICSLAQIKLGSPETINSLSNPVTVAERNYTLLFPHYRNVELRARRWVFATRFISLTSVLPDSGDPERPYRFALPPDFLRAIREDRTEWRQRGRTMIDAGNRVDLNYIANVPVADFDPSFVEVLACRLAYERADKATQSNTKKAELKQAYRDALAEARQLNAFTIGADDISDDDTWSSWLMDRR